MNFSTKAFLIVVSFVMFCCENGVKNGSELSAKEINFIRELGILDENEEIIQFHSQSGELDEVKRAGNFFTDRRVAAYWLDEYDESETIINSTYYSQIDTMWQVDRTKLWSEGSFLEVRTMDSLNFRVYVNGDSTDVWSFFEGALNEWEKWR